MTMDRRSWILGATTIATLGLSVVTESKSSGTDQTRERVDGIGGFFFRSPDPTALAAWYQQHLGVDPIPMDHDHKPWQQLAGPTAFAPFPKDTGYFGSAQQPWMINFRVRNLDAMVKQLDASNIAVKVDPEKYPQGRFARLHDPDGNPIELWEPAP
jgi:glyoxylase I family protein